MVHTDTAPDQKVGPQETQAKVKKVRSSKTIAVSIDSTLMAAIENYDDGYRRTSANKLRYFACIALGICPVNIQVLSNIQKQSDENRAKRMKEESDAEGRAKYRLQRILTLVK